jgi:hypothetical protein
MIGFDAGNDAVCYSGDRGVGCVLYVLCPVV